MSPFRLALALLALAPTSAQAFCGAFVGDPNDTMSNTSSQVIMARHGTTTTLTVVMDYTGSASEFAILLPVPEVMTKESVRSLDRTLVDWIGAYTTPRQVQYTCDDIFAVSEVLPSSGCALGFGCLAADESFNTVRDGDTGVHVENSFTEYGYEFVVLSAEESSSLYAWLDANGYAVPAGGETVLQDYIDAGTYFLAAKVAMDKVELVDGWLPPIQLTYEADSFGLPIKIGTISASGPQDVVIYTLTPVEEGGGQVTVTNYPELTMPNECTWSGDDFGSFYNEHFAEAHEEQGAGWVKEYGWDLEPTAGTGYHCDPCTATPAAPTADGTFEDFGLPSKSAYITRLHMRYTAEQATSDLVFSVSGIVKDRYQLKYIDPLTELESLFPDCDAGWKENPGTCPEDPAARDTGALMLLGLGALGTLLSLRRRRA